MARIPTKRQLVALGIVLLTLSVCLVKVGWREPVLLTGFFGIPVLGLALGIFLVTGRLRSRRWISFLAFLPIFGLSVAVDVMFVYTFDKDLSGAPFPHKIVAAAIVGLAAAGVVGIGAPTYIALARFARKTRR